MKRISLAAGVAVALAVLTVPPSPVDAAGTPTARDTDCGQVLVVGVRGSGQTASDSGGWGREVAAIRDGITQSQPQLRFNLMPLEYPAAAVESMIPSTAQRAGLASPNPSVRNAAIADWKRTKLKQFLASITDGVDRLQAVIASAVENCPGRHIVLAGYSQGAMVVHRTLLALVAKKSPALNLISGSALLADGDRVADSRQVNLGNAAPGAKGIAVFAGMTKADVPSSLARNTYSWCTDNDIVCDATLNNLLHGSTGKKIHTSYPTADMQSFGRIVGKRSLKGIAAPETPAGAPVPDPATFGPSSEPGSDYELDTLWHLDCSAGEARQYWLQVSNLLYSKKADQPWEPDEWTVEGQTLTSGCELPWRRMLRSDDPVLDSSSGAKSCVAMRVAVDQNGRPGTWSGWSAQCAYVSDGNAVSEGAPFLPPF